MGKEKNVVIRTETIKLQDFLKFCNAVASGGEAKLLIRDGAVTVNGEAVTMRGKKLRLGDVVGFGENLWRVAADGTA